jgi:hypothetical protein
MPDDRTTRARGPSGAVQFMQVGGGSTDHRVSCRSTGTGALIFILSGGGTLPDPSSIAALFRKDSQIYIGSGIKTRVAANTDRLCEGTYEGGAVSAVMPGLEFGERLRRLHEIDSKG